MDGSCEKQFFVNTLEEELPTKWRSGMMETGRCTSRVADHDLHQGFFMTFDYHCGTSKFDVKIYDCTQCHKEYEAEVHFQ
jgi:hypothetical protein